MNPPLYIVDAFTNTPFRGNSAAVLICTNPLAEHLHQSIAMEMNLPETSFVIPKGDGIFDLRWFTPAKEVDLCGHATLAAARALYDYGFDEEEFGFDTRSGRLTARRRGDKIELNFPDEAPFPWRLPHDLSSLGVEPIWTGKNRLVWFVQVPSEDDVRGFNPTTADFAEIAALGQGGLIVTAEADEARDYDFVSRCFYPNLGIDEDPVTGSAHCALAPFWSEKLDRKELTGYQASTRGGLVEVECEDDRVLLRGHAVITVRGALVA